MTHKCPRCRCKSFKMVETCKVFYTYAVSDGYVKLIDRQVKVNAILTCIDCHYRWRPTTLRYEVDER